MKRNINEISRFFENAHRKKLKYLFFSLELKFHEGRRCGYYVYHLYHGTYEHNVCVYRCEDREEETWPTDIFGVN